MVSVTSLVNYYELLEISSQATPEQIKEAIKRQRRTWIKRQQAPSIERQREAEDRVRNIDAAETTLLDPASRATFDQRLAAYVPPAVPAQQPSEVSRLRRPAGDRPSGVAPRGMGRARPGRFSHRPRR